MRAGDSYTGAHPFLRVRLFVAFQMLFALFKMEENGNGRQPNNLVAKLSEKQEKRVTHRKGP